MVGPRTDAEAEAKVMGPAQGDHARREFCCRQIARLALKFLYGYAEGFVLTKRCPVEIRGQIAPRTRSPEVPVAGELRRDVRKDLAISLNDLLGLQAFITVYVGGGFACWRCHESAPLFCVIRSPDLRRIAQAFSQPLRRP